MARAASSYDTLTRPGSNRSGSNPTGGRPETGMTDLGTVLGTESSVGDFISLLKPRVSALVAFCALAGILVAPMPLHPLLAFTAVLCVALASGGCGAVNMWFERDIDSQMARTKNRPLPRGSIRPGDAAGYGIVLIVAAVTLMGLALNPIAAAFLALSAAFYLFIYTFWLKRRTPQNIVIGGAAGAFPPLIGWAATGATISAFPWLLFFIVFLWTPPHFWSLSLYRANDYAEAGVPMLPVVYGQYATRIHILLYTLVLSVVSIAPWPLGYCTAVYGIGAILLNVGFVFRAARLVLDPSQERARNCFLFSIVYLYVLFILLVADAFARSLLG